MTGDEIRKFMVGQGVNPSGSYVVDSLYALPTREWFLNKFADALKDDLVRVGAAAYVEDKNDCDKFAQSARALAQWMNNLSQLHPDSIAIGIVFYLIGGDPDAGHAINFTIVREGEEHHLIFFEPQIQDEVTLTEAERESIFFYYV